VRGFVPDRMVRDHALKLARLHGPYTVVDAMKEHPSLSVQTGRVAATQLQGAVLSALRETLPRQYQQIQVQCQADGTVLLTGAVRSADEKLAASMALRRMYGCTAVENQLQVPGAANIVAAKPPEPKVVSKKEEAVKPPEPKVVSKKAEAVKPPEPKVVSKKEEAVKAPEPKVVSKKEEAVKAPAPKLTMPPASEPVEIPRPTFGKPAAKASPPVSKAEPRTAPPKAVETKAVETKAVETKAVETKAVETKAVEGPSLVPAGPALEAGQGKATAEPPLATPEAAPRQPLTQALVPKLLKRVQEACPGAKDVKVELTAAKKLKIELTVRDEAQLSTFAGNIYNIPELADYRDDLELHFAVAEAPGAKK
jgi:hypothetical protein